MNIIISNSSSEPIYEQIKKAIKQAIYTEKLKELEKNISTVVKLSKIYGITEEEVINLIKIMFEED